MFKIFSALGCGVNCVADKQTACAVYALDGMQNDISNAIVYVTSNPMCNTTSLGDMACPACAMQYMQQGLCLPGRYARMCYSELMQLLLLWFISLLSPLLLALLFVCIITNMSWLQYTAMHHEALCSINLANVQLIVILTMTASHLTLMDRKLESMGLVLMQTI